MASKASNQSTLIRLCPEPKISYSDTDINGKDFLVHLTNNLNFALKECELFNTEVRNAINADIQSKIKCFSEGILMDTKKDFLDTSKSSRSENRIYDCTYFDRHNDDYIYNALQKDIGDKKKGDDSIIIQHTHLNALVSSIIKYELCEERYNNYIKHFPRYCSIDFTPIGTTRLNKANKLIRLTDNAIKITGLCSFFDTGANCNLTALQTEAPKPIDQYCKMEQNLSLCIINYAISILKSVLRPLDDIVLRISKNSKKGNKDDEFVLHISKYNKKTNEVANEISIDIKTGPDGYFTVEKLTKSINPDTPTSGDIDTRQFIDNLHKKITTLNIDDANKIRNIVLCLLMCIKTAGDFIKMFVVYILNKHNLLEAPYNDTVNNIYFLTHDKSALNLAMCLGIPCLGGTGSATNFKEEGKSIRLFYWDSTLKWEKTNLKKTLIALGFKFIESSQSSSSSPSSPSHESWQPSSPPSSPPSSLLSPPSIPSSLPSPSPYLSQEPSFPSQLWQPWESSQQLHAPSPSPEIIDAEIEVLLDEEYNRVNEYEDKGNKCPSSIMTEMERTLSEEIATEVEEYALDTAKEKDSAEGVAMSSDMGAKTGMDGGSPKKKLKTEGVETDAEKAAAKAAAEAAAKAEAKAEAKAAAEAEANEKKTMKRAIETAQNSPNFGPAVGNILKPSIKKQKTSKQKQATRKETPATRKETPATRMREVAVLVMNDKLKSAEFIIKLQHLINMNVLINAFNKERVSEFNRKFIEHLNKSRDSANDNSKKKIYDLVIENVKKLKITQEKIKKVSNFSTKIKELKKIFMFSILEKICTDGENKKLFEDLKKQLELSSNTFDEQIKQKEKEIVDTYKELFSNDASKIKLHKDDLKYPSIPVNLPTRDDISKKANIHMRYARIMVYNFDDINQSIVIKVLLSKCFIHTIQDDATIEIPITLDMSICTDVQYKHFKEILFENNTQDIGRNVDLIKLTKTFLDKIFTTTRDCCLAFENTSSLINFFTKEGFVTPVETSITEWENLFSEIVKYGIDDYHGERAAIKLFNKEKPKLYGNAVEPPQDGHYICPPLKPIKHEEPNTNIQAKFQTVLLNLQKCLSKYEDLMTRYKELQNQIKVVEELYQNTAKQDYNFKEKKGRVFMCETLLILYMFLENLEKTHTEYIAILGRYRLFELKIEFDEDPYYTKKEIAEQKTYCDAYKDKTFRLVEKINKLITGWVSDTADSKLTEFKKLIDENKKDRQQDKATLTAYLLNELQFLKQHESQSLQTGGYKNKPYYKIIKNNKLNNRVAKAKQPNAKDAIVPNLKKAKQPNTKDAIVPNLKKAKQPNAKDANLKTKRLIRFNLF